MASSPRKPGFVPLTLLFALFLVFLYGPTLTIGILSFQGPNGGLTFPLNGVSLHWFRQLFEQQQVGDFGGSLLRSLLLGVSVMLCTTVFRERASQRVPGAWSSAPRVVRQAVAAVRTLPAPALLVLVERQIVGVDEVRRSPSVQVVLFHALLGEAFELRRIAVAAKPMMRPSRPVPPTTVTANPVKPATLSAT
jgi:hypothetical protein